MGQAGFRVEREKLFAFSGDERGEKKKKGVSCLHCVGLVAVVFESVCVCGSILCLGLRACRGTKVRHRATANLCSGRISCTDRSRRQKETS